MYLSEILVKIKRVLKDPAILDDELIEEVNHQQLLAMRNVCNPRLIYTGTVAAPSGTLSADMPATYHHDLLSAYSETNKVWLTIRTNSKWLYSEKDMSVSGAIDEVAVDGRKIHVTPMSSEAETLSLKYYRLPVDMAADGDEPDGIDDEFQEGILVSGTLMAKLPESDLDPQIIIRLTALHSGKYREALAGHLAAYPYTPKHTPKARRKVKEF